MSKLEESKELLFLSIGSKWACGLMEYPPQGLGHDRGNLWSQKPPQFPRIGEARLNILHVHVILTFFQSSSAVPSTPRTLVRLVNVSNRTSWALNEGGWYPVSEKDNSRGRE